MIFLQQRFAGISAFQSGRNLGKEKDLREKNFEGQSHEGLG